MHCCTSPVRNHVHAEKCQPVLAEERQLNGSELQMQTCIVWQHLHRGQ